MSIARVDEIAAALRRMSESLNLTQDRLAKRIGVKRKTIIKLMNPKPTDRFEGATLDGVDAFLGSAASNRGFVDVRTYLAIADGIGADTNNTEFGKVYDGEYRILRAHVPSLKPLVSKLTVETSSDGSMISYLHQHVVTDALSLFNHANTRAEFQYTGFVFNCRNRAFFLSTSRETSHVKEMIWNLRMGAASAHASLRGLVLTLSADEREPFAARILAQKVPPKTKLSADLWDPGLKEAWSAYPEAEQSVFRASENRGVLSLRSIPSAIED